MFGGEGLTVGLIDGFNRRDGLLHSELSTDVEIWHVVAMGFVCMGD
jgi:hypothetical protein